MQQKTITEKCDLDWVVKDTYSAVATFKPRSKGWVEIRHANPSLPFQSDRKQLFPLKSHCPPLSNVRAFTFAFPSVARMFFPPNPNYCLHYSLNCQYIYNISKGNLVLFGWVFFFAMLRVWDGTPAIAAT